MAMLLLFAANAATADPIDENEAYEIANEFFSGNSNAGKAPLQGQSRLRLAHTGDAYYAFNRGTGGGFVIVAADSKAAYGVLGYAFEGTFNTDSMPDAMRWWLGEYAREMESASVQASGNGNKVKRSTAAYADIEPLLTSAWDQEEPYNALCPTYQGTQCPTGCVATALAQIMYFYKWPEWGTGSKSYQWTVNDLDMGTLSADFSQSTYLWDAMTDTYDDNSTDASKEAVARLMYDVGIASGMSYGPESSGAQSLYGIRGLTEYFYYDQSANLLQRDYYGLTEWVDILYSELAAGRPIYYSGTTADASGHAFVFDGYRDGYFHVNWGWSGMSNGYFLVSALDPDAQGTGGSDAGYNYNQSASVNLRPAEDGSTITPLMYCIDDFTVNPTSATRNSAVTFSGGFFNFGITTRNMTLGIKVVGTDGDSTYIAASNYTADFEMQTGYTAFNMTLDNFPTTTGNYRVYPAYRDNVTGTWYDMRTPINSSSPYLVANVSGMNIIFSSPETDNYDLSATGVTVESTPFAGKTFKVTATIANSKGEYFNDVAVAVVSVGSTLASSVSDGVLIDIIGGESIDVSFSVTAPTSTGEYEVVVINDDGDIISDRTAITVEEAPSGQLSLCMVEPLKMDNADNVVADDIQVTARIACASGYYGGKAYAYIFPGEGGYNVSLLTSDLYIGAGDTCTVNFSGSFENAEAGNSYYIRVSYLEDNTYIRVPSEEGYNYLAFTVGALTDINAVEAETEASDIHVYSLAGLCVLKQHAATPDLSSLPDGIYIVKQNGKTKKVIKK